MRTLVLIGLATSLVAATSASAQMVAPTRSYSPTTTPIENKAVVPKLLYPNGYDTLLKGATKPPSAPLGFNRSDLKSVVIGTKAPGVLATGAPSTVAADPLTGQEPGSGRMTRYMDTQNTTDLPGQKRDPMSIVNYPRAKD